MRKVMIAGTLKRNDSRPEAESSNASTVPARTTTAPRRASLKRQRLRTRRMTSTSSVRWSMSPYSLCLRKPRPAEAGSYRNRATDYTVRTKKARPNHGLKVLAAKIFRLQKSLFSRQMVRNDGFCRQQQQAGHEQVPPQALPPLGLLARHLLRLRGLRLHRRRVARDGRDELARIDRRQIRLGGLEIDGDRFGTARRGSARTHFIDALLVQLEQPFAALAAIGLRDALAGRRHDDSIALVGPPFGARGQIEHLAHGEPRRRRLVMCEIPHELMDQRQEDRLHADVGPRVVERRRPYDHAARAHLSLRRRDRAIVEPRQDAIGWKGLQSAIAEHVRGREVAAARRLEHLEDRMTVIQVPERPAAPRGAIHGRAQAARQQLRFAWRPRGVVAGHDQ